MVSTKINRIYRFKYFSLFERKSRIFFASVELLKCTLILFWRIFGVICIVFKVETILKGGLDSIPSPSRSCEHLIFFLFFSKRCWALSTNFFAFTPQANFSNLSWIFFNSSEALKYTLTFFRCKAAVWEKISYSNFFRKKLNVKHYFQVVMKQ